MDRVAVTSSNIVSIGHDPDALTLEVEFTGSGLPASHGRVFQYSGVSAPAFEALRDAPSVGSHFAKNIRDLYRVSKVLDGS